MANNSESDHNAMLYAVGVILLAIFLAWYFSRDYVNFGILGLARFNFEILTSLLKVGSIGETIVQIFAPGLNLNNAPQLANTLYASNPKFMTWNETILYLEFIGQNLRPFLIIGMTVSTALVWRSQRQKGLKKKYDLDALYKRAANYYPHLNPVISQDLIAKDPDAGNLAREKTPIVTAIENSLILVHDVDHLGEPIERTMIPTFDKKLSGRDGYFYVEKSLSNTDTGLPIIHNRCSFQKQAAEAFFIKQLGEKYIGWESMRLERRALLAICSLFMQGVDSGGVSKALELNKRINESFSLKATQNLSYIPEEEINEVIKGCEDLPQFKRLIASHGYELTLISSFIAEARTKGKLYFSNMYWIKHTDRNLWFTCDQEGGQKAWSESAAVRAHLLRETSVGMGLEKPHIKAAVDGIEKFLAITEGWLVPSKEGVSHA